MKLDVIATRGGDGGETSLGDGSRLPKHAPRVAAIGEVDEANACLGLLRLHTQGEADALLARAQQDLFDLGADLCVPGTEGGLRVTAGQVARLDAELAALNAGLPALRSFVLPGGTPGAAHAHLARTVVRRAERAVAALAAAEPLNPEALRYLNRLGDLLFVLGRVLNGGGAGDVAWVPGSSR